MWIKKSALGIARRIKKTGLLLGVFNAVRLFCPEAVFHIPTSTPKAGACDFFRNGCAQKGCKCPG